MITLKAHYDGERILLDEPYDLPRNAALIVTILAPANGGDGQQWVEFAVTGLARAYSDLEPEYSIADVK